MTTEAQTRSQQGQTAVRNITPCLTFNDQAEEAVNYYVSIFKNSRIVDLVRSEIDGPIPKGKLLHVLFELNGREYTAFDGGPHFAFTEAFSLVVTCDTQDELDEVWEKLAAGGAELQCGWVRDKFGVAWQVVPTSLGEMMSHPESGNSSKVMEALLSMVKLDIATLEAAYRQP